MILLNKSSVEMPPRFATRSITSPYGNSGFPDTKVSRPRHDGLRRTQNRRKVDDHMAQQTSILLTGGAGYIGSHTAVALVEAGLTPVLLDNFSNSHPSVLQRLEKLTGHSIACERGDIHDTGLVETLIRRHSCRAIVFSSSATVYGDPASVPIDERFPCAPESPYAHSKLVCEQILTAQACALADLRVGVLRYFNPVGAHVSGLIGEDPGGTPNNLMPFIAQVAVGQRDKVRVFGNDYPTPDGTGVRDYLHVCDLARGHVDAVQRLIGQSGSFTLNLGTGFGTSVMEVIRAFERASGRTIPFEFAPRRAGDVAQYFADVSLAQSVLGWRALQGIDEMCRDVWRWQQDNPQGYSGTLAPHLPDAAAAQHACALFRRDLATEGDGIAENQLK